MSLVYEGREKLDVKIIKCRSGRWRSPEAAVVPNHHLPMRSLEVKNRSVVKFTNGKNFMYSEKLYFQLCTETLLSLCLMFFKILCYFA